MKRAEFDSVSCDRPATAQCDATDDTLTKVDAAVRKAALVFEFGRSELAQKSAEQVIEVIEQVFVRANDPKAPKFGTVGIGMTRDEVLRNMGKPVNTVLLEDEEILVYEKLKVRLRDGSVVDVQ